MSEATDNDRLLSLMETLVENHKRSLNALELSTTRYDIVSRDVNKVSVDVKRIDSRFDAFGQRLTKLETLLAENGQEMKAMRQDMASIQSELLQIMHRTLNITNNARLAAQGTPENGSDRRYG